MGEVRFCGDCTLCCTLLGIHQLNKPPLQDCPHCHVGKSCQIYFKRPEECREFDCMWLSAGLPEELKPSKTHVVLSNLQQDLGVEIKEPTVIVYTDPNFPDAYKQAPMSAFLNNLLSQGVALIVLKDGKKHYYKWGKVEDIANFNLGSNAYGTREI